MLRNWGWSSKPSRNEIIIKELGDGIANTIYKSTGTVYSSITGGEMYEASGCTDDWMTTKAGMVGFTIELRDTGDHGFELPPKEIVGVGKEMWTAIQFYVQFLIDHPKIAKNVIV